MFCFISIIAGSRCSWHVYLNSVFIASLVSGIHYSRYTSFG